MYSGACSMTNPWCYTKKSLKIAKMQSEAVNRRRTDNTMAERKSTNNDLQNIHIKN